MEKYEEEQLKRFTKLDEAFDKKDIIMIINARSIRNRQIDHMKIKAKTFQLSKPLAGGGIAKLAGIDQAHKQNHESKLTRVARSIKTW